MKKAWGGGSESRVVKKREDSVYDGRSREGRNKKQEEVGTRGTRGARYEDIFWGWLTRSAGAGLLDRYASTMQAPPAVVPIYPITF